MKDAERTREPLRRSRRTNGRIRKRDEARPVVVVAESSGSSNTIGADSSPATQSSPSTTTLNSSQTLPPAPPRRRQRSPIITRNTYVCSVNSPDPTVCRFRYILPRPAPSTEMNTRRSRPRSSMAPASFRGAYTPTPLPLPDFGATAGYAGIPGMCSMRPIPTFPGSQPGVHLGYPHPPSRLQQRPQVQQQQVQHQQVQHQQVQHQQVQHQQVQHQQVQQQRELLEEEEILFDRGWGV